MKDSCKLCNQPGQGMVQIIINAKNILTNFAEIKTCFGNG